MDERIGFGFTNPGKERESWTCACVWVAVMWMVYVGSGGGGLCQGLDGWGSVMSV